ncbi:Crp/Fnr family transcriptional regulator [Dyella sp. AtDHG13]|uniref:Crp/Fnr family transcriptional regulator n=1 Tax=Dyella sp. AtDHG13 TaxID=1938897 RepID=UPI00131477BF|nr:Crp/Fnr family transcriptional regulator [Dyella sp. AtDHG13]
MELATRRHASRTAVRSGRSTVLDAEGRRALLARSDLFAGLPAPVLDELAGRSNGRCLDSGELVFRKNDAADFAALVVEGVVYAILYGPDGRELIVDMAGSGQAIGEAALLGASCHHFTAVAAGMATVLLLRRVHLAGLLTEPQFLHRVMLLLAGRVSRTARALETMCLYSLESRLARYLLDASDRNGRERDAAQIQLPPTQGILASMLNASRPKLNALLQEWQRAGLISRERNVLRVHDFEQLRRKACAPERRF